MRKWDPFEGIRSTRGLPETGVQVGLRWFDKTLPRFVFLTCIALKVDFHFRCIFCIPSLSGKASRGCQLTDLTIQENSLRRLVTVFAVALALSLTSIPSVAQSNDPVGPLIDTLSQGDFEPEDTRLYTAPLTEPDLKRLADLMQLRIQSKLIEVIDLTVASRNTPTAEKESPRAQIIEHSFEIQALASKYRRVLTAWADKGGEPDEIVQHRRYLWSLTVDFVRTTDAKSLLRLLSDWVFSESGGLRALLDALRIAGLVVAVVCASVLMRRMVERQLDRKAKVSRLLRSFMTKSVYWATLLTGLLIVLSSIGLRVTPLLAVFGGVGFSLGFALQETIGNLASGLMIMINRPFDVGDYIRAGGEAGSVESVSMVSTKIRTPDNQVILIPNSSVWSSVITNVSASDTRRVDLIFGISYAEDTQRAIALLNRLIVENGQCLEIPSAGVFVGELSATSVNIFCRPWVASQDYWTVYWALTAAAKTAFDAESILRPVHYLDVRLRNPSAGLATTSDPDEG
jgi:small conductance mechanosensitive channel